MHNTIRSINEEYFYLLQKAKKRLQKCRIKFEGRKGYIQAAHLNANGIQVDLKLDDGNVVNGQNPLDLEFL